MPQPPQPALRHLSSLRSAAGTGTELALLVQLKIQSCRQWWTHWEIKTGTPGAFANLGVHGFCHEYWSCFPIGRLFVEYCRRKHLADSAIFSAQTTSSGIHVTWVGNKKIKKNHGARHEKMLLQFPSHPMSSRKWFKALPSTSSWLSNLYLSRPTGYQTSVPFNDLKYVE